MNRLMLARSMRSLPGSQIGLFMAGRSLPRRIRRVAVHSNYKGSPEYGEPEKKNAGAKAGVRRSVPVARSADQEILFLLARRERGRVPARTLAATGPGLARVGGIAVFRLDLAAHAAAARSGAREY